MLTKTEKNFSLLYFSIVITELICGSIDSLNTLHYITKPAIVFSLLLFFYVNSKLLPKQIRMLTLLALTFSLVGDILLMFVEKAPLYFMFGLVSFLLAHVTYTIVFLKHRSPSKKPFGFILILLVYAFGLFYLLKNGLGDLLIPVMIYMIAILAMATSAFLRKKEIEKLSYQFVFVGAILFMVSDSILALNKFYQPIPYSNISIMLTYALAQYLIVIGLIKQQ